MTDKHLPSWVRKLEKVLLSVEDYESYQETLHLLRSPANAARLQEAIRELRSGGGSQRELADG